MKDPTLTEVNDILENVIARVRAEFSDGKKAPAEIIEILKNIHKDAQQILDEVTTHRSKP